MWVLKICLAISMGSCGRVDEAVYASKDECFEALSAMKMIEKSGYAWCRPEQKKR